MLFAGGSEKRKRKAAEEDDDDDDHQPCKKLTSKEVSVISSAATELAFLYGDFFT